MYSEESRYRKLQPRIASVRRDVSYFIKGRRSSGAFVLMDINNNTINFVDRGGKQNPSYKSLKRINTRRGILYINKKVER